MPRLILLFVAFALVPSTHCAAQTIDPAVLAAQKQRIEVVGGYQKVPDGPGLGVEVDEEAVERHRVPRESLEPFEQQGQLYTHPQPRLINTVVFPDGRCVHMAGLDLGYFNAQGPAYTEGARVESRPDDGTPEWTDLFERVQRQPVKDRWEAGG